MNDFIGSMSDLITFVLRCLNMAPDARAAFKTAKAKEVKRQLELSARRYTTSAPNPALRGETSLPDREGIQCQIPLNPLH